MKRLWLGTAALAGLFGGAAVAADMPVKAPVAPASDPWSGFYVGLNAGGAWGRSDGTTSINCSATESLDPYICSGGGGAVADGLAVGSAGTGTITSSGFTGGGQAGFNLRAGSNVVFGVEADFDAFKLSGSRQVSGTYPVNSEGPPGAGAPFTVTSSINTDWLATVRGRLGFLATPNWLIYATGGLAITNLQVGSSYIDYLPATENSTATSNKTGWTVGGGVQWALSKNWSLKAEYLYLNFGKVTTSGFITGTAAAASYAQGISTSAGLTAQVARGGINYKF
jgi:outer membrane immunogenic protein